MIEIKVLITGEGLAKFYHGKNLIKTASGHKTAVEKAIVEIQDYYDLQDKEIIFVF